MTFKKLLTYACVIPALVACQQDMSGELTEGEEVGKVPPLVQDANGDLYSPECIKSVGFSKMSQCRIDFAKFDEVRGMDQGRAARGFGNSWWWPYYSYYRNYGYNWGFNWGFGYYGFPYYNLSWYNPKKMCSYWGFGNSGSCYGHFGYSNWNSWPNTTYCGYGASSNTVGCYYTNQPTNPFSNNSSCSSSDYSCGSGT